MSLARRSFLKALIGAPFAAPAIERLIANGVAASPIVLSPKRAEPIISIGSPRDVSVYGAPTVIRIRTPAFCSLGVGDMVAVDPLSGKIRRCAEGSTDLPIGQVVQTVDAGCSDGTAYSEVDIQTPSSSIPNLFLLSGLTRRDWGHGEYSVV